MLLSIVATKAYSQNTSSAASQTVQLELSPAIQINTVTSTNVNIGFSNVNHYSNGVQSTNQEFKVSSNQKFVVSVKTDANNFSYTGSTIPAPIMPVSTLSLALFSNNTGGNIAPQVGSNNYVALSNSPQDILIDCNNGANQTFAVNYKANPGNNYPAGTYTVGVVYTATQP